MRMPVSVTGGVSHAAFIVTLFYSSLVADIFACVWLRKRVKEVVARHESRTVSDQEFRRSQAFKACPNVSKRREEDQMRAYEVDAIPGSRD
jgi:hypothetical protein